MTPTETEIAQTDRGAIFQPDGPVNPIAGREAVRTLLRLPLEDPDELRHAVARRMQCARIAFSAPDDIELMLGVQALSAAECAGDLVRLPPRNTAAPKLCASTP
jgi:hypothetical protein